MSKDAQEVRENGGGIPKPTGVSSRFWDALGILLCLLLAFCSTLFPATNSDLFRHLALGRQLVGGSYDFKTDPVVYTNPGIAVEHTWLYSGIFYLIYSIPGFGPAFLVILKALGAVCTVLLLWKSFPLSVGRMTVPIIAMGLVATGLANRWLLQPFALSVFLLALTLYLLNRLESGEETRKGLNKGALVGLLALFALWVNLDVWFFFGPLAFTVFALGRIFDGNSQVSRGTWLLLMALSWGVCLINPWGYLALGLPINLRVFDPANSGWKEIYPQYFSQALGVHYLQPRVGLNPTGLAFIPLAVLGILLALSARAPRTLALVLVFAVFLLLSLASSRTIPFFCVVGGWAILGMASGLSRSTSPTPFPGKKANSTSGDHLVFPKVAICFLLALGVGFAIPGWIHPTGGEPRAFGLGIKPDTSLESLALWVNDKKKNGEWDDKKNIFHLSLDLSNYLAWYAPGTKGFLDNRLTPSAKAANDFYQLRKALRQFREDNPNGGFDLSDIQSTFKSWNIGYLVFQEGEGRETEGLSYLNFMRVNGTNAEILRLDGTTVTISWKEKGEISKPGPENPDWLAFGKGSDKLEDPEPFREPIITFWNALFPETVRPLPKDFEAYLRLLQFYANEAQNMVPRKWLNGQIALMAISAASPQAMANPGTWTGTLCTDMGRQSNRIGMFMQAYGTRFWEEANPAYLYIAVRAARRALLEQPNDPSALLRLGQAYDQLNNQTLERHHFQVGTPMSLIRRYQTFNALGKVTRLSAQPMQLREAHELLMRLYGQDFVDRTLFHTREYLENIKNHGLNLSSQQTLEILTRFQKNLETLENEVKERSTRFESAATRAENIAPAYSSLEKLRIALKELGLLDTAKGLVNTPQAREQTKLDTSGQIGAGLAFLHLEVLLSLGDADTASLLLSEEYQGRLGDFPSLGKVPAYEWFNVMVAASQGRYQVADAYIKECIQHAVRARDGTLGNLRDFTFAFPKGDRYSKIPPNEMFALNFARHALTPTHMAMGYNGLLGAVMDFRLGSPAISTFGVDVSWELFVTANAGNEIVTELEVCRGFLKMEAGYTEEAKMILTKALETNPRTISAPVVKAYLNKMK